MSTICQHFNTIDVEVCFTRKWGILQYCGEFLTWWYFRGVID